MSTSKKTFQLGFAIAASAALLVSGCAKPASEDVSMEAENSTAAPVAMVAHAKEEVAEAHELVGVWWGTGTLDQQSLNTAIDGLSFETRRGVTEKAATFLATEMAIEFKTDGQLETAVEVTNQTGQRESGMSVATWVASPTINSGEYRVDSEETQSSGLKTKHQKTYRVSQDGKQLTLLVDLPGLLGQCNPRIVLQRQEQQENVAAGQGGLLR